MCHSVPLLGIGRIAEPLHPRRRFIGTQLSTFSGYIPRLRGFIGAPDTLEYYHNRAWSTDRARNRAGQPEHAGGNYMDEDPEMWTTTVGRQLPDEKD